MVRRYSKKPKTIPDKFKSGFLATLDGRTELARALRENYQSIVNDIGDPESISHVKRALIERFCWLEAVLQTVEQGMATGLIEKTEAISRWIQATNAMSGLAKVLGVERSTRSMPWITPTNGTKTQLPAMSNADGSGGVDK